MLCSFDFLVFKYIIAFMTYRQCSECTKSSSGDSEVETKDLDAPRKLREKIKEPTKWSPDMKFKFEFEKVKHSHSDFTLHLIILNMNNKKSSIFTLIKVFKNFSIYMYICNILNSFCKDMHYYNIIGKLYLYLNY